MVLGIARSGNAKELLANGADIAIHDIGEIDIEKIENGFLINKLLPLTEVATPFISSFFLWELLL